MLFPHYLNISQEVNTNFTEMDKVLIQMENDYASQSKWQSYARNNDRKTFMLLFEKDFPNMAAQRYEQNDDFFVRLFSDPELMKQVMETVGSVLYQRLRKRKTIKYTTPSTKMPLAADAPGTYKN